MSDIKEPRFLAGDLRPRFTPPRARRLPETLEDYLSLFAGAAPAQRVGEASPSYLFSHTAAAEIALTAVVKKFRRELVMGYFLLYPSGIRTSTTIV